MFQALRFLISFPPLKRMNNPASLQDVKFRAEICSVVLVLISGPMPGTDESSTDTRHFMKGHSKRADHLSDEADVNCSPDGSFNHASSSTSRHYHN